MKKKDNHSRRGVAIEMAIGVMFVMVALSILLLTYWTLENRIEVSDLNDFHEKVATFEVYDIGEYVYKTYADETDGEHSFNFNNENYNVIKTTNAENAITSLQIEHNSTIILTIEMDNEKSITSWK